ncbi:MAG: hypothetical protein IJU72_01120 [Bacteroidales bacterium]|nr:hypothetical protein [Bacteroidales bacterium]
MTQHFRFDALSAVFTLIFVAINAWLLWRVSASTCPYWLEIAIAALLTICTIVSMAHMPRYTYIDKEQIVVKKVLGELRFNRSDVKVRPLEAAELSGTVRTFGSGGVFGYLGWHRIPSIGKCFALLKNRKQSLTLIEHGEKKYIVHLNAE